LKKVDLPEPLGPIKPCTVPGWTFRSTPETAFSPPKLLLSPLVSRSAKVLFLVFFDEFPFNDRLLNHSTNSSGHKDDQKHHRDAKD